MFMVERDLLETFDELLAKFGGLSPTFKVNCCVERQIQCFEAPDIFFVQDATLLLIEITADVNVSSVLHLYESELGHVEDVFVVLTVLISDRGFAFLALFVGW
jgi:hypothetical protein